MTTQVAAFKAAAAVLADCDCPPRPSVRKPLSIRAAAVKFGVSRSSVTRAVASIQRADPSPLPPGRPRSLTKDEDDSLVAYIHWLQRGGLSATKAQVVSAANELRRRRDPNAPDLNKMWYYRWLKDHPEVQKTDIKAVKKSRKSSETSNIESIKTFLENLSKIMDEAS